ncbi:hypothetical protein NSU_4418 [Novosphingobium pentaromativorans US6-1]|uniref:Uncharacterized protein n=1 Tax=Novosphingobium pentaromativorans US6-1 TaxID=1088721 RepID=G6EJ97_9SPHN|nr:hypothetical protein NSU_4418 [Novosphingobium pentaromativorans US6-1]
MRPQYGGVAPIRHPDQPRAKGEGDFHASPLVAKADSQPAGDLA